MKTIVSYKTETTGLPNWKAPSNDDRQPHLVRLSAIKYDTENLNVISGFDFIIQPDGWVIPDETIELHGITNEHAHKSGIDEDTVVREFITFCEGSELITSNRAFNSRIIRIALKRHLTNQVDEWKVREGTHCAISMAKKDLSIKKLTMMEAVNNYFPKENYAKGDPIGDCEFSAKIYFNLNKI